MPKNEQTVPWVGLLTAFVVSAALAVPGGTTPTTPVKFVAFILCVAVAVGLTTFLAASSRRVPFPGDPRTWPIWAFLAAVTWATLTSPTPLLSVIGVADRQTGWLLYAPLALLVLLAIPNASPTWTRRFLFALAGSVALQVIFGLAQMAGLMPLLGAEFAGYTGTLGNQNFFGAFVGLGVGVGLWLALSTSLANSTRVAGGLLAVGAAVFSVLSNASQGPLVAAIVSGFVLLGWLLNDQSVRVRVFGLAALSAGAVVGTGVLALGFQGVGPLAGVADPSSFLIRTYFWRTAVDMGSEQPLTGVGLDRYVFGFRALRPAGEAAIVDLDAQTDAAHNVLLNLFAGGGWPLAAAAAMVYVVAAVAGVVLIRRGLDGDRLTAGALVGVFAGYVGQSLVSIDMLPLPLVGWTCVALLLGQVTWTSRTEAQRSGSRAGRKTKSLPKAGTKATHKRRHASQPVRLTVGVLCGALALGAVVLGSRPLQADRTLARARQASSIGQHAVAENLYLEAAALAPWEPRYMVLAGQAAFQLGDAERATDLVHEGTERAGGDFFPSSYVLFRFNAGRDDDQAAIHVRDALRLEPNHPDLYEQAREWGMATGDEDLLEQLQDHPAAQ